VRWTYLWKHLLRIGQIAALAATAFAQPPLTTIQDTLYKADGTRFNGLLMITWNSFEAGNLSNIVSQNLTVKVLDGNFRVQLVPTTNSNPPTYYNVKYNSDGKIQFEETWVVGASSTPLRIRDVRASASPGPLPPPSQTPIQESDVVGLVGDLGLRPVKGPGFSAGRAALISDTGAIEAVVGNLFDCVLVDGTSGPCGAGGGGPQFVDGEVLTGIVDGANGTFSLANTPNPSSSLILFRNGMAQKPALDYSLTGATVQFLSVAIPQPGDTLLAWYRLAGAGSLTGGGSAAPEITCSAAGTSTSSANFTSLGSCTIPANVLQSGDRVEIHYDLAHTGTATGFEFTVLWGGTPLVDRVAAAADSMIAGKGEAAVYSGGAQLRSESWGTALAYAASLANATDNLAPPMNINFQMKMAQTGTETVTLRSFTVVRYPAQ